MHWLHAPRVWISLVSLYCSAPRQSVHRGLAAGWVCRCAAPVTLPLWQVAGSYAIGPCARDVFHEVVQQSFQARVELRLDSARTLNASRQACAGLSIAGKG